MLTTGLPDFFDDFLDGCEFLPKGSSSDFDDCFFDDSFANGSSYDFEDLLAVWFNSSFLTKSSNSLVTDPFRDGAFFGVLYIEA